MYAAKPPSWSSKSPGLGRLFVIVIIRSVPSPDHTMSHRAIVVGICKNDVCFAGIVLDAVEDCFSKGTVIAAELLIPFTCIELGTENRGSFLSSSVQCRSSKI